MKRMICLLLSACMLLCLAACGENTGQPPETESMDTTENQDGDHSHEIRLLTPEKTLHTYYEWEDDYDRALVRSEHSCVTLGQADADAYPEMARVLDQIATMQENAMLDEFDNLVSIARDELSANRDGFNWTIDYLGLTFYFSPGELSDDGMLTATVSFAEYPELFNEKYMAVPAEYAVEIPLDISFFAELDTDDASEAISISGWYNDERNHYMDYGIYTDIDGQYYEEECFVYDLHPYYVKTVDGNYVYLFCEDVEEDRREMRLVFFSLNADGGVTKTGKINVSPSWLTDNKFIVPTDPGKLILDDGDNGTKKVVFAVGNNGMPVLK